MEGNARALAAVLILCASLSPLASASFFRDLGRFFNPPVGPEIEPWLRGGDPGDSVKRPPKQTPQKLATHLADLCSTAQGLRTTKNVGEQISSSEEPLRAGFYEKTCPRAEQIVKDVVTKAVQNQSEVAHRLLSLHFHDCFVNGCDASLLLDKTPSGEKTEKQALPNLALQGYEVIDAAKSELEKECPGIVSCADTLAFAARDSHVLSHVPNYKVPSGRRDARASREADVLDNIPEATDPLDKRLRVYERKGLTLEDLVVLEGVHMLAVARSLNFSHGLEKTNGENLVTSMIRMGNFEVLTGTRGEIRKKCTAVN